MKRSLSMIAGLTAVLFAGVAPAHEVDPGGRIVLTCPANGAPRMANVARAVEDSHYWAPQSARREMLALARSTCARGARTVAFVPPADQRYAAAPHDRVAED